MSLFKNFKKFKKRVAIIYDDNQKLSYETIIKKTNELGKKIKKRTLIIIISENSLGSLLSYIFCIIKKHPAIIIDSKTPFEKIKDILKVYKPEFIFGSKKYEYNFGKYFNIKYNFFDQYIYKNERYKKILFEKNLSILLSTSGSMGGIKFAKLSYQNLKFNTNSILSYLKIKSSDTSITNLPISYSYMLSVINTHLEIGGKIVISKYSILQKEFWNIFNSQKITSFNGVPYTYEIIKKIGFKKLKTQNIKYLTQAGGKLDLSILNELINFSNKEKIKFISMYGQTEASPRISYLDAKFTKKKIGSIGRAIPGNKIYLLDQNKKKIVTPYVIGELICEGKNIFMGYSNNYLDLKKKSGPSILMTGDLGYFDKNKFFYVTGRISKIVKIFGNRIDLEFLENKMVEKGFKVACLSDDKKIFLFSEKMYNKKNLLSAAEKITNVNIGYLKTIKLKSFPRTTNNKISYMKLKEKINDRL